MVNHMDRPLTAMAFDQAATSARLSMERPLLSEPGVTPSSLMKSMPHNAKSATTEFMYSCAPGLVKSIL